MMDPRLKDVDRILSVIDTDDHDDTERDLAFAILAIDKRDPATLSWLAAVCVKRAAELASARLEYLRGQLRAECISWGELHELQGLAAHIEPGDVELLEAAGVPEHEED